MKWKLLVMTLMVALLSKLAFGAAPTVGAVSATTPITLNAGTTQAVTCNATVTDLDGYQNITTVNGTLFDGDVASEGSADDNNDHYTDTSCTLSGGSGNTTNAVCDFTLQYYANAGSNWECIITALDGEGNNGNNTTGQTITISQLKAFSVTSLSFDDGAGGTINLGATSAEVAMNITNTGNVNFTVQVNGGSNAMSCGIGAVNLSNERYNTTSGFSFANGLLLTGSATNVSDFVVPQQTNDAASSVNSLYWLVQMPATGVGGSCTGTITVNAN